MKTVSWMTEEYTLLSYYNNNFTPSEKVAVQQLSRHQVSYIKDDRPLLILMLCKYQTSFTCQRKKKFQVNQLQITFSRFPSFIVLIVKIPIKK